jgi:site-specific recombinase XerD
MDQDMIIERIRKILAELPEICFDFFLDIEPRTTLLTRLNYAYDLRTFFTYLSKNIYGFEKPINELTISDIAEIKSRHINLYLDYLNSYTRTIDGNSDDDDTVHELFRKNGNTGKKRKLVAIRVFFKFLYKHKYLASNVADLIEVPKIREKVIVRLENDEVQKLFNVLEQPSGLSKRQCEYALSTQERDMAIITLMLGTGIRVSECVGIDMDDIDWEHSRFKITRKGGNEAILYFNDEVLEALKTYCAIRTQIVPVSGQEKAFFLSLQKKRISQRSVQILVKKYAHVATPIKHITPHKLRSTYGTALYQKTGDIYLVADVLGHKDINVTRRHYAAMSEEKRKMAADAVRLHEDKK